MEEHVPSVRAAVVAHARWELALENILARIGKHAPVDLIVLFASGAYADYFPAIIRTVRHEMGSPVLIGCSSYGVIGSGVELEDVPALSLLALSLPGASLHAARFTQEMLEQCPQPSQWRDYTKLPLDDINAWLIFADPFRLDCEELIDELAAAYPGVPMLGGLASGDLSEQRTYVFLNDEVYGDGGVGLAIGGDYTLLPLVSQGCEPIGKPWIITDAHPDGLILAISNRPAYDVLLDTIDALTPGEQRRAWRNLLIGLAANEYYETFTRGCFLIRTLLGVERGTRGLVVSATPRIGQTIQFQVRDPAAADLDFKEILRRVHNQLGEEHRPVAGVLCSCNGRGIGMFGVPSHDAKLIARELGPLPLTGLFCNGEIGPVGKRPFLHGFTASLALLMQRDNG
ncbi:MAG: FIST C-terminal domain-containing protein [Ktedonobacteraceae bacterium]|nr:FIST C-terminal domain-containing protein [Ktedonobacteraceae bacterium]MBO0790074.1 FIST C-terminal domain-containing protein [Ktedonobacteraceae bacterium]